MTGKRTEYNREFRKRRREREKGTPKEAERREKCAAQKRRQRARWTEEDWRRSREQQKRGRERQKQEDPEGYRRRAERDRRNTQRRQERDPEGYAEKRRRQYRDWKRKNREKFQEKARAYQTKRRREEAKARVAWDLETTLRKAGERMARREADGRWERRVRAEVRREADEALRARMARVCLTVRESLIEGGVVVAEMDRRGLPVQGPAYLVTILRRIGAGTLLADVVVEYGGRGHTFDAVKALPVEQQQEMLKKPTAEVEREVRYAESLRKLEARRKARQVGEVVARCLEMVEGCANPERAAAQLMRKLPKVGKRRKAG